jgi:hypothetical protein
MALWVGLLFQYTGRQRDVDLTTWREGVVAAATEMSRGGGCGKIVQQYFDDIDDALYASDHGR